MPRRTEANLVACTVGRLINAGHPGCERRLFLLTGLIWKLSVSPRRNCHGPGPVNSTGSPNHRNALGYTIRDDSRRFEGGANIVWGWSLDRKEVSITEIEQGGRCGLTCDCGVGLVAKKGSERAHHFAHEAGSRAVCEQAQQGALGRFALKALTGEHVFRLPQPHRQSGDLAIIGKAYDVAFGAVRITAQYKARRISIYLAVRRSQAVDLRQMHLSPDAVSSMLVDLTAFRSAPDQTITDGLMREAARSWLHNARAPSCAMPQALRGTSVYPQPELATAISRAAQRPQLRRDYQADELAIAASKFRIRESLDAVRTHRPHEADGFCTTRHGWLSDLTPIEYNNQRSDLISKTERWLGLRDGFNRPVSPK